MNDVARLALIVAASLAATAVCQRLCDRRAARRLAREAEALGLSPRPVVDVEEIRRALPFLAALAPARPVALWEGSIDRAEAWLVALRAPGSSGYTLLARRTPLWTSRVVVRPRRLRGGPPAGGQDPRRRAALESPALLAALARDRAWLQVEGPWRVLGIPRPASAGAVRRLAALLAALPALAPEPEEFSGGLEWNV